MLTKRLTSPSQLYRRAIEQCESLGCPGCAWCCTQVQEAQDGNLTEQPQESQEAQDGTNKFKKLKTATSTIDISSPDKKFKTAVEGGKGRLGMRVKLESASNTAHRGYEKFLIKRIRLAKIDLNK